VRQGLIAWSIGAVLLGAAWPALADEAVLTRNANLRRDPSTARPPIRRLAPPDEVEIIDPTPTNGYYHVRDEDNEEGWVWGGSIRILSDAPGPTPSPAPSPISPSPAGPVASTISAQWQKPAPNQTHCLVSGALFRVPRKAWGGHGTEKYVRFAMSPFNCLEPPTRR